MIWPRIQDVGLTCRKWQQTRGVCVLTRVHTTTWHPTTTFPAPPWRRTQVLRSSIREFLCSEAMHFLDIPTTRAAALATSDTKVRRDVFYTGNVIQERASVRHDMISFFWTNREKKKKDAVSERRRERVEKFFRAFVLIDWLVCLVKASLCSPLPWFFRLAFGAFWSVIWDRARTSLACLLVPTSSVKIKKKSLHSSSTKWFLRSIYDIFFFELRSTLFMIISHAGCCSTAVLLIYIREFFCSSGVLLIYVRFYVLCVLFRLSFSASLIACACACSCSCPCACACSYVMVWHFSFIATKVC